MIDSIKELAIMLCGLLVVISAVEAILPDGNVTAVVKWVLLLFVLLSVVDSIKNVNTDSMLHGFEPQEALTQQGSQEVLHQTVTLLEDRVYQLLHANGVEDVLVNVTLSEDETGLNISNIIIANAKEQDKAIIQDSIDAVLGNTVEVIYE